MMTVSVDGNPVLTLRAWAAAYRAAPKSARFPSDPNAEFLPRDLDVAADAVERLTSLLAEIEPMLMDAQTDAENEPSTDPTVIQHFEDVRAQVAAALRPAETKGRG